MTIGKNLLATNIFAKQRCRAVAAVNPTQLCQLRQRDNSARSTLTIGSLRGCVPPLNWGMGASPQHQPGLLPGI
jgi:hypothetical protein